MINGKLYIGKTTYSVTKRFLEHCNDSKKERCEKRPLYDAMNKYGVENFIVEQVYECDNDELSSYEVQFIDKFNTYSNGYNATKGGDGSILFDYNLILELYQKGMSMKLVAAKVSCSVDTVSKVVHINNIPVNRIISGSCKNPVKILLFDLLNNFIKEWDSIAEAAHWLVDNGYAKTYNGGVRQKISLCIRGKLKTAYKFIGNEPTPATNNCLLLKHIIFFVKSLIMGKLTQELTEYLSNASDEQLEEDFKELESYNEIGPDVNNFLKVTGVSSVGWST